MKQENGKALSVKFISAGVLHIIAMGFMLCDHLWGTIAADKRFLTAIGRIAFPIFAFLIAEGLRKTSNVKKYLLRLFIFAIISEVPFNLMMGGRVTGLGHQNVLWTFIISILLILLYEKIKRGIGKLFKMPSLVTDKRDYIEFFVAAFKEGRIIKGSLFLTANVIVLYIICFLGFIIGTFLFVDYFGPGVLTVFIFYFLCGDNLASKLLQLVLILYVNVEMLAGLVYQVHPFGHLIEIPEQGLAVLSFIFIWLYSGKKGYDKKWFRYFCYAFYPAHMLILFILQRIIY